MNPDELLYTKEHEWLRIEDGVATIGITAHAQEELGDVVYVELPSSGDAVEAGSSFGTVESVKAVSELFTPLSGEVLRTNETLADAPELVNNDPYGRGWMIEVRFTGDPDDADLMSAEEYLDYLQGNGGE
jgi:glycine cleavage system H protein